MRLLTENEKEDVKMMLDSRGFKVMEGLVKDFKIEVMEEMLSKPLGDTKTVEILTGKQNYLKGIYDFIQRVKSSTSGVGKRKN